ncbi:MAG: hypothetical protein D6723_06800 [Acidobacteria bacterium]|nr:MAG: hypothetical protein D6723_06800 [Acidobacteriota bacterium]
MTGPTRYTPDGDVGSMSSSVCWWHRLSLWEEKCMITFVKQTGDREDAFMGYEPVMRGEAMLTEVAEMAAVEVPSALGGHFLWRRGGA